MVVKVKRMELPNGKIGLDQYIITVDGTEYFQSYDTVIACKPKAGSVYLDPQWKSNKTTGTYRNHFLGLDQEKTQCRIDRGEFILHNLNE